MGISCDDYEKEAIHDIVSLQQNDKTFIIEA